MMCQLRSMFSDARFFCKGMLIVIAVGIALRLAFGYLLEYNNDITAWTQTIANQQAGAGLYGMAGYYYTPTWGYILAVFGELMGYLGVDAWADLFTEILHVEDYTDDAMVTTPAYNMALTLLYLVSDLVGAFAVYWIIDRITGDAVKAKIGFAVYFLALNVIMVGAVWGQFDTFSALMAVLCVCLLVRGNDLLAGMMFSAAALLKIFPAVLILVMIVYLYRKGGDQWKRRLTACVIGAAAMAAVLMLPSVMDGTVMDSFTLLTARSGGGSGETSDLILQYSMLAIYPILGVLEIILAWYYLKRYQGDEDKGFIWFSFLAVAVFFLFPSTPQYILMLMPFLAMAILINGLPIWKPTLLVMLGGVVLMTINPSMSTVTQVFYEDLLSFDTWQAIDDAVRAHYVLGLNMSQILSLTGSAIQTGGVIWAIYIAGERMGLFSWLKKRRESGGASDASDPIERHINTRTHTVSITSTRTRWRRLIDMVARTAIGRFGNGRSRMLIMALAVAAVSMMVLSSMPVGNDSEAAPASIPSGDDYYYQFTYSTTNQQITSVTKNGTVVYSSTNTGKINDEYWSFDDSTGLGPFNTFYAAINVKATEDENAISTRAGEIAYILKPSNLNYAILPDGKTYQEIDLEKYNVMLVIPTVYWYSDGAGNMYMSNTNDNPHFSAEVNSKMRAYAHTAWVSNTVPSKLFPYLAIGVYESSVSDGVLLSKTGAIPKTGMTMHGLRGNLSKYTNSSSQYYVNGSIGSYQMWNYGEWTLYKIMCQTVMGTKNVRTSVGMGAIFPSSSTGSSNGAGWYGSLTADDGSGYGKLFIENAWGSNYEYIDNTGTSGSHQLCIGNGLVAVLNDDDVGRITGIVQTTEKVNSSNGGYIATSSMNSRNWDMPKSVTSTDASGYGSYFINNHGRYIRVGGGSSADNGLSSWVPTNYTSHASNSTSRLAFLMDAPNTITYEIGTSGDSGTVPTDSGKYIAGQSITVKDQGGLHHDDPFMEFTGWVYEGTVYTPGESFTLRSSSSTLTSYWAYPIITITFNGNGSDGGAAMEEQRMSFGKPYQLKANTYTKTDNVFSGWTGTDDYGGTYHFDDCASISIESPGHSIAISLVAIWGNPYTISYDVGTATVPAPETITTFVGATVTVSPYTGTSSGLYFAGWTSSLDGKKYLPGTSYTVPAADTIFTATFATGYTVTYDTRGGEGDMPEPAKYARGMNVRVSSTEPTMEDYIFKGWRSDAGDVLQPGGVFTMPSKNVKLTAIWDSESKEQYEEDEDDILDILRHTNQAPGQQRSHTMDWVAVAIGAVAVTVAGCLVVAVWRRRRYSAEEGKRVLQTGFEPVCQPRKG